MSNSEANLPAWSALLTEAVEKPGMILEGYSAFHNYSLGNQMLAMWQCALRGITPGPINTYPGWQSLGRNVKAGEKAIQLCMPITCKSKEKTDDGETKSYTAFVYKARWFVATQTAGEELQPVEIQDWTAETALAALGIEKIEFDHPNGNTQGYAKRRQIAINPIAQLPHKTMFHELAHVVLGHTEEFSFDDSESTPGSLREVEAESVALLCCESLSLTGADYCRGYIQEWLKGAEIPEKSAQKIFKAADQILKAGKGKAEQ